MLGKNPDFPDLPHDNPLSIGLPQGTSHPISVKIEI